MLLKFVEGVGAERIGKIVWRQGTVSACAPHEST
jgi:hypothetical protein